jgi:hypothetical protein
MNNNVKNNNFQSLVRKNIKNKEKDKEEYFQSFYYENNLH